MKFDDDELYLMRDQHSTLPPDDCLQPYLNRDESYESLCQTTQTGTITVSTVMKLDRIVDETRNL